MDFFFIFTLALHLACRTGAQSTTTAATPDTTNPTTVVPVSTTTVIPLITTATNTTTATTTNTTTATTTNTTATTNATPTPGHTDLTTVPGDTTLPPTVAASTTTSTAEPFVTATTASSTTIITSPTTIASPTSTSTDNASPTPGHTDLTTIPADTTLPPTVAASTTTDPFITSTTASPNSIVTSPTTAAYPNTTTNTSTTTNTTNASPTPGHTDLTTVPGDTTLPPTVAASTSSTDPVITATTAYPFTVTYPTSIAFPNTTAATFVVATNPPPTTKTTIITTPTTTTTTTITTTTRTPPPTTPLICDNGGEPVSGVCICPDEWTGERCSVENFCHAQQLDGYKFPRTPIGWFAYSDEICPEGSSGAGKPRASTRCSTKNGPPSFELPQVFQCDQTLSDIQQNLTSPADLEKLASSTQILTSKPEELTPENITTAAQIANTLLLSPNATQTVRVAAIATVSQLLNASTPDDSEENNATLDLTKTLDQLSVDLSLSSNTSQSQVVQPNLVVQSVQIAAADTLGVQFTSLSGTSGSFVEDRILLNTNTSTIVVENGISDALVYVRFPPAAVGVYQQPENVSLGFVLYQNNRFFRSRRYSRRRATVRVLSASIRGQERRTVPQHVEMLFRPKVLDGTALFDFACVFWDYSLQDWSTDGCSKGNAADGLLRCFCNHTTNFAALWSFRENYEYAEALDVISIVGLSFSILGLVVTIIHHLVENFQRNSRERKNSKNSKLALLSICVGLLAFILTFLSGVGNSSRQYDGPVEVDNQTNAVLDSDEHVEPDRGSCTAVVALLHFFLLATFSWNFLYGLQVMLLVRTMRRSLPPYWTTLSVTVGWGVPAIAMASTLGGSYSVDDPLGYRQEEFCWLAALDKNKQFDFGKPMFWGFLLPLALILSSNVVLLVLASLTTCRTDPALKSTRRFSLWKKFLTSLSLTVLLGLSWTLGFLVLVSTGPAHLVISILFCLCTTTQGFQIFILFTARTPSFRAAVSTSFRHVSSVNIHLRDTIYRLQKSWATTSSEFYRGKDEPTEDH